LIELKNKLEITRKLSPETQDSIEAIHQNYFQILDEIESIPEEKRDYEFLKQVILDIYSFGYLLGSKKSTEFLSTKYYFPLIKKTENYIQ